MTPKEKAKELCNKFLRTYKISLYPPFNPANEEAKQCALIAVDEIINIIEEEDQFILYNYWLQVKTEIEQL